MELWISTPYKAPTVPQVLAYLSKRGWIVKPPESGPRIAYKGSNKPGEILIRIQVPSQEIRDLNRRLVECLEDIARSEGRRAFEVCLDVLAVEVET